MEQGHGWNREIDENLAAFIAERDSLYLGTSTADGQPYIQHRGGKPGFLEVLDERTLGFADFRGNPQPITPRFTQREVEPALRELEQRNRVLGERIRALESPRTSA